MIDEYVVSEGRKLRMGITTGTCAALAAQGAVRMLLSGREVKEACLVTPKGIRVTEPLLDISISDGAASFMPEHLYRMLKKVKVLPVTFLSKVQIRPSASLTKVQMQPNLYPSSAVPALAA